jgi:hypothetical protein
MSSYKSFTSDARAMDAKLSSAQGEMKVLEESLAAASVILQSMMAEAQRTMSTEFLVNVLHPALSAHVTLINMRDVKSKLIANMERVMCQPVYFAALEACAEHARLEAKSLSEVELIESVVRTVNEDEIRGMIQPMHVYPGHTMERPSEITEGTIAGVNCYNGPRTPAVKWCTPCVVVKCFPDGRYIVCLFKEYSNDFEYRMVTDGEILGQPIV